MRGRGAVLGVVLGAASSLVVDGVAMASGSAGAVAAPPISLDAPVGIAAVGFGVVGLVAGLLRRRRAALVRPASAEEAEPRAATGI